MPEANIYTEKEFRELFETYKKRVFGYALTITKSHHQAEEITQELFIKLWTRRDLLVEVENLDSYIMVMARNRTLTYARDHRNSDKGFEELSERLRSVPEEATNNLIEAEYNQLLINAVDQLSTQRKRVYDLSRGEGLGLEAIAEKLNISYNTAKAHLVESLRQIREELGRHGIGMLLLFLILND